MLISCFRPDNAGVPLTATLQKIKRNQDAQTAKLGVGSDGNSSCDAGVAPKSGDSMMANATPSNKERSRPRGAADEPPIEKSTVEVRQGRGGRRVLIIMAVSLGLLAIACMALHFY